MKAILPLILIILVLGCNTPIKETKPTRSQKVEQTARKFFDTFADRSDWNKFLSFYSDELEFDDVTLQLHLDSLWKFKRFYNWEDGHFKKLTPDQKHMTVESLIANDSVAVAHGHFNPFYYYNNLIDTEWGMEFTIWLYFDENLKIKKQIDWIEYDSSTLESVIKRCRENGHEAIPDWLDLSKKEE